MANQTVSVNRNFDDAAINGLANGEDLTINTGAKLTINSDSRWSLQGAVIGNITIDTATGGECHIDGTTVWWLPFNTGTGTVPARGITVSRSGGASGELLGVFTALGVAETAPAAAMPATGFLKLRSVTSGPFTAGALTGTGLSASATGAGQRGWLHIVGEEATTITVPRRGTFRVTGDWFELGTTSGADDQTFQYYVADFCPAIWVETGAGTGIYEQWLSAGSRWGTATVYISTDARGKFFDCTAAGVIKIAQRASNSCGFKPPTGCKVRVPNIHVSASSTTNWAVNLVPHATLATRWDMTTTSAGVVLIDKMNSSDFYLSISQAFQVEIQYAGFMTSINLSEVASAIVMNEVGVGLYSTQVQIALVMLSMQAGGTFTKGRFCRYSLNGSGDYAINLSYSSGFTFNDTQFEGFAATAAVTRGNAAVGVGTLTTLTSSTFNSCALIGGRMLLATCEDLTFNNPLYADCHIGLTTVTNGMNAIDITLFSKNIVVSGFANFAGLANVHPYNGIINITATKSCKLRNIGTAAAPYNMGTLLASSQVINTGGNNKDFKAQRVYVINTRTAGLIAQNNTDNGMVYENVWGDTGEIQIPGALNMTMKGMLASATAAGQVSVYGTHFSDMYVATTGGRLLLSCNEKTAIEPSASAYVINAGTPVFNSAGSVIMATVGDQITWTWSYFIKGHTSFQNSPPTVTGVLTSNISLEYDLDRGSGFSGSWKTMNAANLNAEAAISATTGFRLKIRATTTVAAATNALTYIRTDTNTSSTDRETQYPLDSNSAALTLSGLKAGSEVRVYRTSDDLELGGTESSGTSFTYNYTWEGTDVTVYIRVHHLDYEWLTFDDTVLGTAGVTIPVQQRTDRNFLNP